MGYSVSPTYWYLWCDPLSLIPTAHGSLAVFLVFRWLAGFAGAAFLSVAGGSVSDLFHNDRVAK